MGNYFESSLNDSPCSFMDVLLTTYKLSSSGRTYIEKWCAIGNCNTATPACLVNVLYVLFKLYLFVFLFFLIQILETNTVFSDSLSNLLKRNKLVRNSVTHSRQRCGICEHISKSIVLSQYIFGYSRVKSLLPLHQTTKGTYWALRWSL